MSTASSRPIEPRARDLGIPLDGIPGPRDAITDVPGVAVGFSTLVRGSGPLRVGEGPVRTGVTAILPRGLGSHAPVFAAWFPLNGNGEMTGTAWIDESGFLESPILLTNTHSVGVVRDAVVEWQARTKRFFQPYSYPVVAETYDGTLNDINGFHVKAEHAIAAIESATEGDVAEGNVGGGTGMVCFGFKGGTGTASRRTGEGDHAHTVGVLVQANFGLRSQLTIAGVPVGRELPLSPAATSVPRTEQGSIIVVVATDAPLLPHQLARVARRAALGLGRTGSCAGNGSGDIMIAFSTANPDAASLTAPTRTIEMLSNAALNPVFDATIFATEAAILNALVAAETMTGIDDVTIEALPHDRVRELLTRYGRG
ncbi:DmpA family aminopeptidase [Paraliomyxa miuraensis]|uniref:DmpA family aminopeptidase n=1 Tax=Paraliomyxa miuraensis TaxID=376150 RepID=UPI002259554A|nr:P1 family peptidase [Paraliomyxa miuraensis]MCX4241196.1 P1 family peptidase [Paraliomyxa miuraensis]